MYCYINDINPFIEFNSFLQKKLKIPMVATERFGKYSHINNNKIHPEP